MGWNYLNNEWQAIKVPFPIPQYQYRCGKRICRVCWDAMEGHNRWWTSSMRPPARPLKGFCTTLDQRRGIRTSRWDCHTAHITQAYIPRSYTWTPMENPKRKTNQQWLLYSQRGRWDRWWVGRNIESRKIAPAYKLLVHCKLCYCYSRTSTSSWCRTWTTVNKRSNDICQVFS